jgi:hypothetical protein
MMNTAAPLTAEQLRKLDRLRHFATRYEIEIVPPNGAAMLVCYTPRRTMRGFMEALSERWAPIIATGIVPQDMKGERIGRTIGYRFENGAIIRFSGRTQRDAIMSGELTFIGAPD